MLSVRSLVKKLDIFERNKVPLDLKVLGLAFYIQLSSLRRAARALSEIHRVSKTAVWKWVRKLSEKICIEPPRIPRRLFPFRNALAAKLFIEEALKCCDGTPTFAVDSAPWLTGVLKELGLRYNVESLRRWEPNRVSIFILQAEG
jgi:hypothetical protein